jgi:hypothetical protein
MLPALKILLRENDFIVPFVLSCSRLSEHFHTFLGFTDEQRPFSCGLVQVKAQSTGELPQPGLMIAVFHFTAGQISQLSK